MKHRRVGLSTEMEVANGMRILSQADESFVHHLLPRGCALAAPILNNMH